MFFHRSGGMSNMIESKHPKQLQTMCLIMALQRFGYYGMQSLLILYMIKHFGFSDQKAMYIFGLFLSTISLIPIVGGVISDRFLGPTKLILAGIFLMTISMIILSLQTIPAFILGLCIYVLGRGLFEPCIKTLVGNLYRKNSNEKDTGYTIFYTSINIGSFVSVLICGYVGMSISWKYGFLLSAAGTAAALVVACVLRKQLYEASSQKEEDPADKFQGFIKKSGENLSTIEKQKLFILLILAGFSIVFMVMYSQGLTSLILFADRYTDRQISTFELPITFFRSLNPFMVILISPILIKVFQIMRRNENEPSGIKKMAIGMIFLFISFAFMLIAAYKFGVSSNQVLVHPIWLILTYLALTMAELLIEPIGMSLVSQFSPKKYSGSIMSLWIMTSAVGSYISAIISGYMGSGREIFNFFVVLALINLIATIIFVALMPVLKKLAYSPEDRTYLDKKDISLSQKVSA